MRASNAIAAAFGVFLFQTIPAQAAPPFSNGDFESGTSPWKSQPAPSAGCETAARINCPPDQAATCGEKAAHLGTRNGPFACEFSAIYQTFNCSAGGTHCTIQFQAYYPAEDSIDQATVQLGGVTRRIPVAAGWQTYKLSAAGCADNVTVAFTLQGGLGFPQEPILIDNVTAGCSAMDETSPTLIAGGTPVTPGASDPPLSDLHDVPLITQLGTDECGPTAAASCLQFWRNNGFPNLKTRDEKNSDEEFIKQLRKDAMTNMGGVGTDLAKLTEAMNKLVNEGKKKGKTNEPGAHKGQLVAKGTLSGNDIRAFDYVDGEFEKGEDILILVCWREGGKKKCHFVTVRRITGTGATRTVQFMDPQTGMVDEMTLTDPAGNGKLEHNYDGTSGTVEGFISMSPDASATSSLDDLGQNGKKITYNVYFPPVSRYPEKQPKDMHIRVDDCDPTKYQVTGLPAGWMTSVAVAGDGKCYLSVWKGTSTNDLTNGQSIVVTYTGSDKVAERERVITLTTDGNNDITNGALPPVDGYTVVSLTNESPLPPSRVHASVANLAPGTMDVILAFEPPEDPSVIGFEVYNNYTREVVASSPLPVISIPGLSTDTPYSFSVASVSFDDYRSDRTRSVFIHVDEVNDLPILPGGPQILDFAPTQRSWHADRSFQLNIPNAFTSGQLIVSRIDAFPDPPHPEEVRMHRPYWNLHATAVLGTNPLDLAVPYLPNQVYGNEEDIRMFFFNGSNWIDVTAGVDPAQGVVFGQIPQPGSVVLINGVDPPPLPLDEYPDGAVKNRYISFQPNPILAGVQHGYEVTHVGSGETWGISTPRVSPAQIEGQGLTFLVSDPFPPLYDYASIPQVHVGGCMIAPGQSYEVRTTLDGVSFSPPLVVSTAPMPTNGRWWADIVGQFSAAGNAGTTPVTPANSWTPPDGSVSGFDISAALQAASSVPTAPSFTWTDINPEETDRVTNGPDVLRAVNAFSVGSGKEFYPYTVPGAPGPQGQGPCPVPPQESDLAP
ncbi:MAG: hypothetical protein J5J06_14380 [Phycisphaerae bacterium]|nr:hypothetical protein [Phycisphaerae bacterium]